MIRISNAIRPRPLSFRSLNLPIQRRSGALTATARAHLASKATLSTGS